MNAGKPDLNATQLQKLRRMSAEVFVKHVMMFNCAKFSEFNYSLSGWFDSRGCSAFLKTFEIILGQQNT